MQVSQVKKHKDAEPVSEKQEESEAKARDLEEELRLVRAEKVGFFILFCCPNATVLILAF